MCEEDKIRLAVSNINYEIIDTYVEGPFLMFETGGLWSGVSFCDETLWDDEDCAIPYVECEDTQCPSGSCGQSDCGNKKVAETQEEITAWLKQQVAEFSERLVAISTALNKVFSDEN